VSIESQWKSTAYNLQTKIEFQRTTGKVGIWTARGAAPDGPFIFKGKKPQKKLVSRVNPIKALNVFIFFTFAMFHQCL